MSQSGTAAVPHTTLQQAARLVGGYCWVERRLFALLGAWADVEVDLSAKLLFAAHSRHHGWHAELWEARLPMARGLTVADLVVPPSAGARAAFGRLDGLTAPEATTHRLLALNQALLPRLMATYREHLDRTSEVADGPVARALVLALRDDEVDQRRGASLAAALLALALDPDPGAGEPAVTRDLLGDGDPFAAPFRDADGAATPV